MGTYTWILDTMYNLYTYVIDMYRNKYSYWTMCVLHHVLDSCILNTADQER